MIQQTTSMFCYQVVFVNYHFIPGKLSSLSMWSIVYHRWLSHYVHHSMWGRHQQLQRHRHRAGPAATVMSSHLTHPTRHRWVSEITQSSVKSDVTHNMKWSHVRKQQQQQLEKQWTGMKLVHDLWGMSAGLFCNSSASFYSPLTQRHFCPINQRSRLHSLQLKLSPQTYPWKDFLSQCNTWHGWMLFRCNTQALM